MQRNVLNLCLKKLASGDASYGGKVAARLANRLVFVPAEAPTEGAEVVYGARTVPLPDGRKAVPVFTTERLFADWATAEGLPDERLSVLGADFCAALDVHTPILIDPSSDHEVVLEPELVDDIAVAPIDEEQFAKEEEELVAPGGLESADTPFRPAPFTPAPFQPAPYRPPPPGAPGPNFVKAGPPPPLFQPPGTSVQNFRKASGSVQSPVIMSSSPHTEGPEDDGSNPKKKSFLKFLKSAKP